MSTASGSGLVALAVAGADTRSASGPSEGASAAAVALPFPHALVARADGSFLVATGCQVWRVAADGRLALLAGNGRCEFAGDGGPAVSAGLVDTAAMASDGVGGVLIADGPRVRRISPEGVISTVAGNGTTRFSGDGGPALEAGIVQVVGVSALPGGGFVFAERDDRVRRVGADAIIETIAGTGRPGYSGDGGPATRARFRFDALVENESPVGLLVRGDGGLLVADPGNEVVRRIGRDGRITTVAGVGSGKGSWRDGVPARRASLSEPRGLLDAPGGGYLIADEVSVREVSRAGIIRGAAGGTGLALAGVGTGIFNGEGRAPSSLASNPVALARSADGGLLIASRGTGRVLSVSRHTTLPAVAITETRVSGPRWSVRYVSSVAGSLQLTVSRGRDIVATTVQERGPGHGLVAIPQPSGRGIYRLDVALIVAGRTAATSTVGVFAGMLSVATARAAVARYYGDIASGPGPGRRCHRFSPIRIDCAVNASLVGSHLDCEWLDAITTASDGLVRFREYDCPRRGDPLFRLRPTWKSVDFGGIYALFGQPHTKPAPLLGPVEP
jgi:hypothetical protein